MKLALEGNVDEIYNLLSKLDVKEGKSDSNRKLTFVIPVKNAIPYFDEQIPGIRK